MATIRSVGELAATARGRRLELGLTQGEAAARARVSRDWLSSFEAGKGTVELARVLRLLETLALQVQIVADGDPGRGSTGLDTLLDQYGRR